MNVVYNALENIDLKATYLTKVCNCGSVLNITYEDVFNLIPDGDGKIHFYCPCCKEEIELYKYFGGKKYSLNQYAECVDSFKMDVLYLLNGLVDINNGHGIYCFKLSGVHIIPYNAKIYFYTYIDEYKIGDWSKKIAEHKLYANDLTIDISSKIVCNSAYEYAQYTQALTDYIVGIISSDEYLGFNNLSSLIDLQIVNDVLIQTFRDPNIDISKFDFTPTKYRMVVRKNEKESRTIFAPEIKDGLEYVGNKIETGSCNIANSICGVAAAINAASVRETNC